ncbi:unnamed protein product [Hydatigera taeniaeformis]|uniref:Uncharacterized protein n=1 Tax=Hydatigena taeniaeformis TaxID=6205 RepID=A0A0R3WYP6_HYDTA|nr:unnamed protein product [Hydatigera taeniaeformis]
MIDSSGCRCLIAFSPTVHLSSLHFVLSHFLPSITPPPPPPPPPPPTTTTTTTTTTNTTATTTTTNTTGPSICAATTTTTPICRRVIPPTSNSPSYTFRRCTDEVDVAMTLYTAEFVLMEVNFDELCHCFRSLNSAFNQFHENASLNLMDAQSPGEEVDVHSIKHSPNIT